MGVLNALMIVIPSIPNVFRDIFNSVCNSDIRFGEIARHYRNVTDNEPGSKNSLFPHIFERGICQRTDNTCVNSHESKVYCEQLFVPEVPVSETIV